MAAAHHQGQGPDSTVESCVVLAASVAQYGLREGRSVGLVSLGAQGLVWRPPRQGEAHGWDLLAALAEVQPGDTDLADLVRLASRRLGGQTSLMAITPCTKLDQFEPLLAGEGSRRPAQAGVILLEGAPDDASQVSMISERLKRRGLLTWVIRQAELGAALQQRAPQPLAGRSSAGWSSMA